MYFPHSFPVLVSNILLPPAGLQIISERKEKREDRHKENKKGKRNKKETNHMKIDDLGDLSCRYHTSERSIKVVHIFFCLDLSVLHILEYLLQSAVMWFKDCLTERTV
jgi:hypothetical protein